MNYDFEQENFFLLLCTLSFNVTLQEEEKRISLSADRYLKIKFFKQSFKKV